MCRPVGVVRCQLEAANLVSRDLETEDQTEGRNQVSMVARLLCHATYSDISCTILYKMLIYVIYNDTT